MRNSSLANFIVEHFSAVWLGAIAVVAVALSGPASAYMAQRAEARLAVLASSHDDVSSAYLAAAAASAEASAREARCRELVETQRAELVAQVEDQRERADEAERSLRAAKTQQGLAFGSRTATAAASTAPAAGVPPRDPCNCHGDLACLMRCPSEPGNVH